MATTNFVDQVTVIGADWLNDVDAHVYNVNTLHYHLGTEAAAVSHTGVAEGFVITTDFINSSLTIGSGSEVAFTNTTTIGKAGNWPDDDGYFYDNLGQQFDIGTVGRVEQFGAVCDATTAVSGTNDTTALQAAYTRLDIIYQPRISQIVDKLTLDQDKILYGDNRTSSGFFIDATFNIATATSCLEFTNGETGPIVRDIGFFFDQPDTTVRGSLVAYPEAIDASDTPRFILEGVRISQAMTGVNMTGNSGGSRLLNLEIGAYDVGIDVTGSLDIVFMDNIEFWPYEATSNNRTPYDDGTTIGLKCNSSSFVALSVGSMSAFVARIEFLGGKADFSSLQLDDQASLLVSGGADVQVGTCYSTQPDADNFAVKVTGADTRLLIGTLNVENSTNLTGANGLIQMLGTGNATLVIGALSASTLGADTRILYQTGGFLFVNGGFISPQQNISYNEDVIDITGGECHISNLTALDKGTGTGNIIALASDSDHSLSSIIAPGWTVEIPTSAVNTEISDCAWQTLAAGTRQLLAPKTYILTSTLDGSGTLTIAHGLLSPNDQYPLVQVYKVSGANRIPIDVDLIDATNVEVSSSAGAGDSGVTVEIVITVRLR